MSDSMETMSQYYGEDSERKEVEDARGWWQQFRSNVATKNKIKNKNKSSKSVEKSKLESADLIRNLSNEEFLDLDDEHIYLF